MGAGTFGLAPPHLFKTPRFHCNKPLIIKLCTILEYDVINVARIQSEKVRDLLTFVLAQAFSRISSFELCIGNVCQCA